MIRPPDSAQDGHTPPTRRTYGSRCRRPSATSPPATPSTAAASADPRPNPEPVPSASRRSLPVSGGVCAAVLSVDEGTYTATVSIEKGLDTMASATTEFAFRPELPPEKLSVVDFEAPEREATDALDQRMIEDIDLHDTYGSFTDRDRNRNRY